VTFDLQTIQIIVGIVAAGLAIVAQIFGWLGKALRWIRSLFRRKPTRLQARDWFAKEWISAEEAIEKYVDRPLLIEKNEARTLLNQVVEKFNAQHQKIAEMQGRLPWHSGPMAIAEPKELLDARARSRALADEMAKLQIRATNSDSAVEEALVEQLTKRKLIARGILPPLRHESEPVEIPAHHWKSLRFDDAGKTRVSVRDGSAFGPKLHYVQVEISKA
jgi:hypothetical protein